ncbi:MAG: hypothetical protein ACRC3B_00180 [Bacteroidia bacterium]
MELIDLYNNFLSEGYRQFYIDGIGGPIQDDVTCLGFNNPYWEVYYIERGQKSKPKFSTTNKKEAIDYYSNYVSNIEHWHLVVFSRSADKLNEYKYILETQGIRTVQNDIPHFMSSGDRIFRLFVVNKDIFHAQKILAVIPDVDPDLKKYGF